MNKKIFTLLVGAIVLVSSMFTVNAQTTPPYEPIKASVGESVLFRDMLTADTVKRLPTNYRDFYYLLSVTGIANPTSSVSASIGAFTSGDLMLSIDNLAAGERYLRLETLAKLDTSYAYHYGDTYQSHKFGALRSALWCVQYSGGVIAGSNIVWDFTQIETGQALQSPLIYDDDFGDLWDEANDGNMYYNPSKGINTFDQDLIVNGWYFSQVYHPSQNLQTGMALYSYVRKDSVVVLVLEDNATYDDPNDASLPTTQAGENALTGGWKVTVKHVSVFDLTWGTQGLVYDPAVVPPDSRKHPVQNVLLFTLKKVNPFVMNAYDWNAVAGDMSFDKNADTRATNKYKGNSYINPFTDSEFFPLEAFEVNDSLYHYGYMQFKSGATNPLAETYNKWLFVDTAFVNYGNNQFLAFAWSDRRDSTQTGDGVSMGWGGSFTPSFLPKSQVVVSNHILYNLPYLLADWSTTALYWRLDSLIWSWFVRAVDETNTALSTNYDYSDFIYDVAGPYYGTFSNGITGHDLRLTYTQDDVDAWNDINLEFLYILNELGISTTLFPNAAIGQMHTNAIGNTYPFLPYATSPGTPVYTGSQILIPQIIIGGAEAPRRWDVQQFWPIGTTGLNTFEPGLDADGNVTVPRTNLSLQQKIYNSYVIDSTNIIMTFLKDSIMENQSKFRVVYDPTADSTWINVYQTRRAYPDFSDGRNDINNLPPWWTNSFGVRTVTGGDGVSKTGIVRPSDLWTRTFFDGTTYMFPAWTIRSIEAASMFYFLNVSSRVVNSNDSVLYNTVNFEGHGNPFGLPPYPPNFGLRNTLVATSNPAVNIFNFHSFMDLYPQSTTPFIDRVLISTADTARLFVGYYGGANPPNYSGLGHIYGTSTARQGWTIHSDSLFYIDLQDLGGYSIITLSESYKGGGQGLDTQIKIQYGEKCDANDGPLGPRANIDNDLYLIRNTMGEYLSVPLWSTLDSIYWHRPEYYEDLTKMPSYQWAIINFRDTEGSPFRMVNREFERVEVPYAYVYKDVIGPIQGTNGRIARSDVVGAATTTEQALAIGSITPRDFTSILETKFDRNEVSFIRLGSSVKSNQLLGYKYLDYDATYIDIYAFKWFNALALPDQLRYLSWKGYNTRFTPDYDSTLYANAMEYYDKLYFNLQEMTYDEIGVADNQVNGYQGPIELKSSNIGKGGFNEFFADLYKELSGREHQYNNGESIVLERFGYWQDTTIHRIKDLRPLARQAYRLFLSDYYKWHPTEKGHYVTVGEQDFFVLSDKANASRDYIRNTGKIAGLFGIPHFYFRETFFEVDPENPSRIDPKTGVQERDYFAIIQRLDTARITDKDVYFAWGTPRWDDIIDYMTLRYGLTASSKLDKLIELNREHQLALLDIEDHNLSAKFIIRGDAAVNSNISSFQLERDDDPIYRRFHMNEPNEDFGDELLGTDEPDRLEFFTINDEERGLRLYENSGNYTHPDQDDRFLGFPRGDGGRVFNRANNGAGDYFRDSLNNVLSFLGANNSDQYPYTNRVFYLDTAYINRGTGWIKPQYMLVVDPYNPVEKQNCDPNTGQWNNDNQTYVLGRYLYNSTQYVKPVLPAVYYRTDPDTVFFLTDFLYKDVVSTDGKKYDGYVWRSDNYNKTEPVEVTGPRIAGGDNYVINTENYPTMWERFAFSWAIHIGDSLYVLKGIEPAYEGNHIDDPQRVFEKLADEYGVLNGPGGSTYIDFKKLVSENIVAGPTGTYREAYWPAGSRSGDVPQMKEYHRFLDLKDVLAKGNTIGLQAIIDLSDNTHKDWVFSFRYIERGSSSFVIESETTDRDMRNGAIIRPGYGGWLKIQNMVPAITRSDLRDNMGQAAGSVMNVHRFPYEDPELAVGNEAVSTDVAIISGTGSITILNATGKKVFVSNILGQTIANTTLTSNNATIAAPAGVIVVAIEGESAVKVVVK